MLRGDKSRKKPQLEIRAFQLYSSVGSWIGKGCPDDAEQTRTGMIVNRVVEITCASGAGLLAGIACRKAVYKE